MGYIKAARVKTKYRPIGIKWKMVAILIGFVFVLALAIWVFQIRMLNFFYQNAKFDELKNTSDAIANYIENESALSAISNSYAEEYYSDIWVYKIRNGVLVYNAPIVFAEGTKDSLAPFIQLNFNDLYKNALQNKGTYVAIVPLEPFKESCFEFNVIKDNMGEPNNSSIVMSNLKNMSVVYTKVQHVNSEIYFIVQRTNISPIETMIKTTENQVLFVGTFLIICAVLLATVMSKLITRPIIKINESAKGLAAGKYNTEFSGHGYREIEELSDTLNYVAGELSKNDRLQKELISNVSHDLRTPLTMIKGYSEIMRDIPGENTPENIQVIIDETARLTELVNDMFDLSKIQSGVRRPDMKVFCLTETIKSTMHRYEKLTMQNGYKIFFDSDMDVDVYADSGMILQVVYNLINNAINYAGEDKIILVKQTVNGDSVRISITDNGDGISEEDIPLIWDRYYKVDKAHKRAMIGTGLGLSIVKGILELHNATYGVTSIPQRGSTFWFELKIANKEEYRAEIVEV